MSLTDLACKNARPQSKPYKLTDSGGLILEVLPSGYAVWRYRYRIFGKEKSLTIGQYPYVSLSEARNAREVAKTQLVRGIDPSAEKQEEKRLAQYKNAQTVEVVAREWHKHHYSTWSERHAKNILSRLEQNVFPSLGKIPISKLAISDVLNCLQKIEGRGACDLTRRIKQNIGQFLRYAVVTGRATRDFTPDLRGSLKKYRRGNFASIEIEELPDFLLTLEKNERRLFPQTIYATKLLMLTLVRTTELINAKWPEFDFQKKQWAIPAERMKMKRQHIVPLSKQTIAILIKLKELYGDQGYILPSVIRRSKPISNSTILKGLDALGYKGKMTGHGFRSLGMSTIKQELGYRHEVVDRQLAHLPKNDVDKAYDRAKFIAERTKMLQKWADYIDKQLRKKLKV